MGQAPRSSSDHVGNAGAVLGTLQTWVPGHSAAGTGTGKWGSDLEPKQGEGSRSLEDQDRKILDLGHKCRCLGSTGERSAGEGLEADHSRGHLGHLQG